MNRKDRTMINKKARQSLGSRFASCSVGQRMGPDGECTWDYEGSVDLWDNCTLLADFKLPEKDWSGTLDIWVYSYTPFTCVGDTAELEFNLYARIENGRLISVEE
jgi:hypothetical protein|tara:strand:+ start:99 stop:413 length:315 start_codon:yes stop_codon:yes gene_type:complete